MSIVCFQYDLYRSPLLLRTGLLCLRCGRSRRGFGSLGGLFSYLSTCSSDLGNGFFRVGEQGIVLRQLDILGMDHTVYFGEWRHIDFDILNEVFGFALYFKRVQQVQQNATLVLDRRCLADEMERNFRRDALIQIDAEEIDVQNLAATRVALHVANQSGLSSAISRLAQGNNAGRVMPAYQLIKSDSIYLHCLRLLLMSKDIGRNDTGFAQAFGRLAHYLAWTDG